MWWKKQTEGISRLSYLPHYPACNSVLSVAQSFLLPFTKDEFLSAVLKYSLSIFNQRAYWNKIEWESRVNFKFSSLSSCCLGANLKGADSLIKAQNFKWNKDEYSKCNLKDIDLKSQTKAYFFSLTDNSTKFTSKPKYFYSLKPYAFSEFHLDRRGLLSDKGSKLKSTLGVFYLYWIWNMYQNLTAIFFRKNNTTGISRLHLIFSFLACRIFRVVPVKRKKCRMKIATVWTA